MKGPGDVRALMGGRQSAGRFSEGQERPLVNLKDGLGVEDKGRVGPSPAVSPGLSVIKGES